MVGSSSQETDRIGSVARAERAMDYFAGLDVSMEETHVCVVDRDGLVIHEANPTSPRRPCHHSAKERMQYPLRVPTDVSLYG